jgi:ABC-2 type transport system permease protein
MRTAGSFPVTPLPPVQVEPHPWRGLAWLSRRECHRVLKLWRQTILAPVISALLFMIVFGLSLGDSIARINGFDYEVYIVPGLIAMAMAQAAYSNNSSTIFQARNDRYLDDILSAPMSAWQVHLGYLTGGAMRSLMIGALLTAVALPLTGAPLEHPFELLLAVLLTTTAFGALGIIVGIYAQSWDNQSFINNIVILPLIFLGGVFYSVTRLGSPWEQISHFNPLFYVVDAVRFGFLGSSDVAPAVSLGVVAAITLLLVTWSQVLFSTGHRLKP